MEIYRFSFNPELAEIQGKQKLYSSLYAEDLKRVPEPMQYPYPAIPEEDVVLLQQFAIGMLPEHIGNKLDVENRLHSMRRMGVDFCRNSGKLSPRERQLIFHFQNGITTTCELAERLNTSTNNIKTLRLSVEKKLKTTFKPTSNVFVAPAKPETAHSTPWRTEIPASMLEYSEAAYKKLEESRRMPAEINDHQSAIAAAVGV